MTLSRDSRLVRWAYWYTTRPDKTSLCNLFWCSVVFAPVCVVVTVGSSPIWIPLYLCVTYGEKPYRAWVARREQKFREKWERSKDGVVYLPDPHVLKVLWLSVLSMKKKFCPIIDFY